MKDQLIALLEETIQQMKQRGILPEETQPKIQVTHTKDKSHGDLATNLALVTAKAAGLPPREMAQKITDALGDNPLVKRIDIAGPGFINFFLNSDAQTEVVKQVLESKEAFGTNTSGNGEAVQVEFVSANPTGPLHVGHGRGAAIGDSLCRVLSANGWRVTREFYYNDAGQQINNLARSVQARAKGFGPDDDTWPTDGYRGHYITEVAEDFLQGSTVDSSDKHVTASTNADDLDAVKDFAVAYLRREQDLDLKAFAVDFDVYFLESSLYHDGSVEKTVERLVNNGFTYEKDGALWLKTTEFGDDKDRVMRKSDGGYTYFVPDIAYHLNKFNRGFGKVINEQGADHHSTITRVRAGLQALQMEIPEGYPEYVLHQMVTVMRGGEEVKISKRAGSYVTLRDLIDEVGRDATRYFLVARRPESQLTFDIDLAKSQTNDNPVYYIQYAHARVCSAFRKLTESGHSFDQALGLANLNQLTLEAETQLANQLSRYPELVKQAGAQYEPHIIAYYLRELAADLHAYYQAGANQAENRWIVDDDSQRNARFALIAATRQVIANGLDLLGVSAPESM